MHTKLNHHFKNTPGVDKNYHMESIEKNIVYLAKVIARAEEEYLTMLKRGGIVEKAQSLQASNQ